MLSKSILLLAAIWSTVDSLPFPDVNTNTTRKVMRLSGTFSVADTDNPDLGNRFGGTPQRPSDPRDAVITFKNGDSIVSLSPGCIDRTITQGILQMALNIDQTIGSEGKALLHDENTIFSPASISMALALVMLGARGRTLQEVSRVLGIATPSDLQDRSDVVHEQFGTLLSRFDRNPSSNAPTQVSIANGVFIQRDYPVSDRYQRLTRSLYRSDVIPVDFRREGDRAGQIINRWVEDKTLGRIRGFLSQAPAPETQILLASAIYFNGQWEYPFPIEATRKRPFYVTGSKQNEVGSEVVEVDMMANGIEVPYLNDPDLDCQIVGLPYKGGKVVMWAVLPNARGYEGLNRLKSALTNQRLESLVSRANVTSSIVSIPRMKLEATLNLRTVLQTMGIECLFESRCSDLGGISSGVSRGRPTSRPPLASSNKAANRPPPPSFASSNNAAYRPPPSTLGSSYNDDSDKLIFASRFGETNDNSDSPVHEEDRRRQTKTSQYAGVKGRRRASRQTNPGLYVDDVIHKVEIEITELGTVASAVTALSISRDGSHAVVRFDRPFLFFIRHEDSKLMLFWGAVVRPT